MFRVFNILIMSSQDQQLYVPSYKNHCFLREVKDGTDTILGLIDDNMEKIGDGAYLGICNALRDMRKHMETRTPAEVDTIRRQEASSHRESSAQREARREAREDKRQIREEVRRLCEVRMSELSDEHKEIFRLEREAIKADRRRATETVRAARAAREAERTAREAERTAQRRAQQIEMSNRSFAEWKVNNIFRERRYYLEFREGINISACDGANVKLLNLETAMVRFAIKKRPIYRSIHTYITLNVDVKKINITPSPSSGFDVGLVYNKNAQIKLCVNGSSTTRLSTNRTFQSSILTAIDEDNIMFKSVDDIEKYGETPELMNAREMCGESLNRVFARKLCDDDVSNSEFSTLVNLTSTTFGKIVTIMSNRELMQSISPLDDHHRDKCYKSRTISYCHDDYSLYTNTIVQHGPDQPSHDAPMLFRYVMDFYFTTQLHTVETAPEPAE